MFRPLIPTQQMKRRQNDHHHQGPPQKSKNLRSTPKITTSNRSTKLRLVSQPTTRRLGGYDSAKAVPIDRTRSLAPCRALLPHPDTCTDKTPPRKHKVLMTENFELALAEGKIAVLYSRIEELKRQGKWSLRQPQKFYDPFKFIRKSKRNHFTGTTSSKKGNGWQMILENL